MRLSHVVGGQSCRHRLDALALSRKKQTGAIGFQWFHPISVLGGSRQAVQIGRKASSLCAWRRRKGAHAARVYWNSRQSLLHVYSKCVTFSNTVVLGSWSTKAPLLTPRAEVAVASVDGKIYVLGGAAPRTTASQLNQEYDPATDRWRDRAPLPHAMTPCGAVGLNGKLYAIGGFTKMSMLELSILFSNTISRLTLGGSWRRSAARADRSAWLWSMARSTRSEGADSTR